MFSVASMHTCHMHSQLQSPYGTVTVPIVCTAANMFCLAYQTRPTTLGCATLRKYYANLHLKSTRSICTSAIALVRTVLHRCEMRVDHDTFQAVQVEPQ